MGQCLRRKYGISESEAAALRGWVKDFMFETVIGPYLPSSMARESIHQCQLAVQAILGGAIQC